MRDVTVAPPPLSPLTGGLADSIFDAALSTPERAVLARRSATDPEGWEEVSAARLRDEVVALARGFVASGISPGHRVAVMARTRYEWTVLSYALWTVGAEIVPVYPTSSRDQVEWILRDSGCVGVIVEDEATVMTVGSVCAGLDWLRHVWQLDAGALEQLAAAGESVPVTTVDSLRRIVFPDSTAAILYTSGTSGRPLGCALSHAGLASPCDTLLAGWGHTVAAPGERPAVLAFLPFSHVYGLMIQGLCIRGGLLMGHEPDMSGTAITAALRSFRPTYLYAVPSVFEKIYKGFLLTAQQSGRGGLFERAAQTAREFATAVERQRLGRGSGPGFDLRMQHAVFERTVYRRLRAALGGRVRRATSGGSTLHRDLSLFYEGIGVYVHDGYGLTETGGGITMQPLGREKSGTVGRALPGTDVRVADDGEILVQGPSVFQGYVGDEPATRAALRGGWLATGDLGHLDSDGYLTITGRKKDVIVTTSGKSVSPTLLEQRLRMHPLVHQAVVVGDNRPCVGALITLDPQFLAHWRARLALQGDVPSREAREENALREEIGRAVAAANSAVSRSEPIRVFRILPRAFDQAGGLLTPSMKLRRDSIVEHWSAEIEAMYQARAPIPRYSPPEALSWDDADDVFR
ncbi:AMP-dependent synthetase/ligase [Streptomyces acidiscabies]|uniref:AMP-dependent synthetase/ligase n=1 Tax=Streptomyces acidiscabies TaxID=42234 RepID=UPI00095242D5|nr:AMP-dependent synthetase/ligase [Streptomyces acidiscabies]